ncbi:MAG: HAMP domain-containing sensor histidine kinase [Sporomusaceae bacterium]|nr:HAMP domain-containing sensor histidine kinase [Sporomusaceae bacterium]
MFQKLRLRLTLINAAIILTLFLFLTLGSYFFSQADMSRRADFLERRLVADIQRGMITDLPPRLQKDGPPSGPERDSLTGGPADPPPPGSPLSDFFFVKISPAGTIVFRSSGQPLAVSQLEELTKEAMQSGKPRGRINFAGNNYNYLKAQLEGQSAGQAGTLVLFHDFSRETGMMGIVLTALTGVGFICVLLSFGASFWMANRAMIPIQKAWQQQKDFLADASHELRTPLTVIRTNLDVVRGSPEESVSSQSKWLDNIQEETVSMAKLVDSLLFLARVDSQQPLLLKRFFFFDEALMEAVSPFEAVAAAKGVFLKVSSDTPVGYDGDEARIKQLVGILLDNAIRHTPSGGVVSVSLLKINAKITLSVADTGEGIDAAVLEKIFDRFFQADNSRSGGSSGLGLAIAKVVAESHGGKISVSSAAGEGATFVAEFPDGDTAATIPRRRGKKFSFC